MEVDFEKIHSPFVRKYFRADRDALGKFIGSTNVSHRRSDLRSADTLLYLVTPEIEKGYEWVFDDPDVLATEKLDGTNIKVVFADGKIQFLQNRKNPPIHPLEISCVKRNAHLIEGVMHALARGRFDYWGKEPGYVFGELIGPKLQGNPYKLVSHEFYPFPLTESGLVYKSYQKYPKTFENIGQWMEDFLGSIFYSKRNNLPLTDPANIPAEGVVFVSPSRRISGKTYMAKLRRDMWRWFYKDVSISNEPVPDMPPKAKELANSA